MPKAVSPAKQVLRDVHRRCKRNKKAIQQQRSRKRDMKFNDNYDSGSVSGVDMTFLQGRDLCASNSDTSYQQNAAECQLVEQANTLTLKAAGELRAI